MIIDRRTGLIQLLREGLRALLVLFAWDIFVVLIFQMAHRRWMDQPSLPTSLIGSALVLFLSVRNNAAYARWWEARTLWGAVTNNARSFSRADGDAARRCTRAHSGHGRLRARAAGRPAGA